MFQRETLCSSSTRRIPEENYYRRKSGRPRERLGGLRGGPRVRPEGRSGKGKRRGKNSRKKIIQVQGKGKGRKNILDVKTANKFLIFI
jgi:hypothetical protein